MAEIFEEEDLKFQRVNTEPNEESESIRYQAVPVSFIGPLVAMFDSSRLPEIVRSLPHCSRLHCVSRFVCASS